MQLLSNVIDVISNNSSSTSDEISSKIKDKLDSILGELLEQCDQISAAMISSIDGISWAEKLKQDFDKHRFAAMSSALLALSDNLAKEGQSGMTQNVMIEGDNGKIFVMHAGEKLLLTVFTSSTGGLGISLAYAKQAAEKIAFLIIDN